MITGPREWAEQAYNIARWTKMPRGGHFPAAEEPQLLATELREFFRPLRSITNHRHSATAGGITDPAFARIDRRRVAR